MPPSPTGREVLLPRGERPAVYRGGDDGWSRPILGDLSFSQSTFFFCISFPGEGLEDRGGGYWMNVQGECWGHNILCLYGFFGRHTEKRLYIHVYEKKNYKPHVETGVSLLNINVPGPPPLWCSPCLLWN